MNSYDQLFYDSSDTTFYKQDIQPQFSLIYLKQSNEYQQQCDDDSQSFVYLYSKFYFAFKGPKLYKVSYACNPFEFISGLRWEQFYGFGVDDYLKLKIQTRETKFIQCPDNTILLPKFLQIYHLVCENTSIERLQAARILYNVLPNYSQDKDICDLYYNLLQQVGQIKKTNTFQYKKNIMTIDFIVFTAIEYQHFPEKKKNCNKQQESLFRCKVCQIRKSKYYCEACFRLTRKKWCFCLDKCFRQFHIDPQPYFNKKITN